MDLPAWTQRFFVTVWIGFGVAELSGIPLVGHLAAGLVAAVFGGVSAVRPHSVPPHEFTPMLHHDGPCAHCGKSWCNGRGQP